jgi:hypothetical protein
MPPSELLEALSHSGKKGLSLQHTLPSSVWRRVELSQCALSHGGHAYMHAYMQTQIHIPMYSLMELYFGSPSPFISISVLHLVRSRRAKPGRPSPPFKSVKASEFVCCSTFVNLRRNLSRSKAALARIKISKPGEGESLWNSCFLSCSGLDARKGSFSWVEAKSLSSKRQM